TLIDFASDRRAPTPTAAAEMAIPARSDLLADVAQKASRLIGGLNRVTQDSHLRLVAAERRIPDLPSLLRQSRERLTERGMRLTLTLPNLIATRRSALVLANQQVMAGLRHVVAGMRGRASHVLGRVTAAPVQAGLREARARLEGCGARLESVSPLAVLQRGYALVTDPSGHPLTSATLVRPGARLHVRFADGQVKATADGGKAPVRQGSLPL